jgi:hypothetical protein
LGTLPVLVVTRTIRSKEGPIPVGLITEREVYILLRKLVGIDAAGVEESRVIEQ